MTEMTKSEWIESEYKKWEELFEIPFEDEFNVKALLDLRWQFLKTSEQHVRTKSDLINAMERLQKQLKLKRKVQPLEKVDRRIVVVVDNENDVRRIASMFEQNLDNVTSGVVCRDHAEIQTSDTRFFITNNHRDNLQGHKCQVFINATMDKSLCIPTTPAKSELKKIGKVC